MTSQKAPLDRRALASSVLALALASGALLFSSGASSEGGGTPIGDQGIEAQRKNQALQHEGSNLANSWSSGGVSAPDRSHGAQRQDHGNRNNHNNNYNRGDRRYYGQSQHNSHGQRYYGPRYDTYAYASPYYYAPPPLAYYDPYPSPGLSFYFSF